MTLTRSPRPVIMATITTTHHTTTKWCGKKSHYILTDTLPNDIILAYYQKNLITTLLNPFKRKNMANTTDYSIYADFLARLQSANSEEEKSWMLMEFSLNQLPPTVSEAVWVAAIPHQFDENFLSALLENDLTNEDWKILLNQSYIEHLWDGGNAVHESTRYTLLVKLFQDNPQHYRELNLRAANCCLQQNQEELHWQVATLYHQSLADSVGIEVDLHNQLSDWWNKFQCDKIEALIRPILEEVKLQHVNDNISAVILHWQHILESKKAKTK